jgi:predicted phosphodiesterase
MRILAISDVHTEFQENLAVLQQLSETLYRDDILIVAGDIASQMKKIQQTLLILRAKFRHVFYLPGNHELWVKHEQWNSLEKFFRIRELCDRLGIHTRPMQVEKIWIVPLFSWYSADFDHDGHQYRADLAGWRDFRACRWPEDLQNIAEFFYTLNEPHIHLYDGPVISFSHFVPRPELLPPRPYLFFKALPQVAGSLLIEQQLRRLQSVTHVFGHSHITRDHLIDGVRYVQNPLGYPREQRRGIFPEKIIWHT